MQGNDAKTDHDHELENITNIMERYLTALTRFGVPRPISGVLVLMITYFSWQLVIYAIVGDMNMFSLNNMFFVRDILAILFITPAYLIFINKVRKVPFEIEDHIAEERDNYYEFFYSLARKLNSNRGIAIMGIIFAMYFFLTITFYVINNLYSYAFYLERLIGVLGLFLIGGVAYQAFQLLRTFAFDVRDIKLKLSALYVGLLPIAQLGTMAAIVWIMAITVIMIPTLVYGMYPLFTVWYVVFYGGLYLLGIVIFLVVTFGFHIAMIREKEKNLVAIGSVMNNKFTDATQSIGTQVNVESLEDWLIMVQSYESIINCKEWPFNLSSLKDLILSYVIPIILTLLGIQI